MPSELIKSKLRTLPPSPGVYFHKNSAGEIIYVGKASILKNRVRHYFQNTVKDPKTTALVAEIADLEWREVDSEIDALFLEAELIKRYQPKWNILLRDDKTVVYVRIDMKLEIPDVTITRTPAGDNATYIGPFYSHSAIRSALRSLRKVFPYYDRPYDGKKTLNTDLGLTPGIETGKSSPREYKRSLRRLILCLEGGRKTLLTDLKRAMEKAAKQQDFESAAIYKKQYFGLRELERKIVFSDIESIDLSKDFALVELQQLLRLPAPPRRIEGYDISHHGGDNAVASMVVFTNGVSDRAEYRKFKIRHSRNNDFANLTETLTRRLKHSEWLLPDLCLIDGGIPQLRAVGPTLIAAGLPFIGLAERFETVILPVGDGYQELNLPESSHLRKLLIRIRDEAHRFAVSYHTYLKRRNMLK